MTATGGPPQMLSARTGVTGLEQIPLHRPMDRHHAVVLRSVAGSAPPAHLQTTVRSIWNDRSLFMLFEGRFRSLRFSPLPDGIAPTKTHRLWEVSDVFEFFIGPDARRTRHYREFQVDPAGRWLDIDVDRRENSPGPNHDWISGVRCSSFVDRDSAIWRSVLQIPWESLGADPDSAGEWHGNAYRASGRFHGDELLSWSPTGDGPHCFHRPEHFGNLVILP